MRFSLFCCRRYVPALLHPNASSSTTASPRRPRSTHTASCALRAVAVWPGELEMSLWSICVCPQDPQGDDFEIDVYPRVVSLTLRCRVDAPPAPGPHQEVPVTKSRPAQVPVPLRRCPSCGSISSNNEKTAARLGKPSGAKSLKSYGDIQDQA